MCTRHHRFPSKIRYDKNIPNEILPVTLDVKSLYTNIRNNKGIKAVIEAYDNHPTKTVAAKLIITFLSSLLTLINFVFKSINCLQIMACAMRSICAPAYANIFMAQFEKTTYIPTLKINQYYTCDIWMNYS